MLSDSTADESLVEVAVYRGSGLYSFSDCPDKNCQSHKETPVKADTKTTWSQETGSFWFHVCAIIGIK
jgi:hypothetical protein